MLTYDSVILAAIASELSTRLANGRTDHIHQPEPLDLVLGIRAGGSNQSLLISADARFPRVHLTATKRQNPKTPPDFVMILRKHLEGSRLTNVEQVDFDRILHLKFRAFNDEKLTLIIEIMGRHSNIILVNGDGRILGAIKHIGKSRNRYREILPGRIYIPPPPQNKINPLETTGQALADLFAAAFPSDSELSPQAVSKWLAATFTGVSPFVAREILARAADVGLPDAFQGLCSSVTDAAFDPVIITDDHGQTVGFYPLPSAQYPAANQHERPSVNLVADVFYMSELPRDEFEHTKEAIFAALRHHTESKERTIRTLEQSIAEAGNAERLKQAAELLLSQPDSVEDGASEATLTDYYDPSAAFVTFPLDPTLSRIENAEAYFRRYRKAVSGADALRDRLKEARDEMALLSSFGERADSCTSGEEIRDLAQELETRGISVRPQQVKQAAKQKPLFEGHRIRVLQYGEWEILVGENSMANDYLLTRVAKPNDIWVHAKAITSAHVIIRTKNRPDAVPQSVLHAAAEQAARHSAAKHSSLVPVDYTLRKYVRKPRGAPAGKAIYQNEKTIYITP